MERITIDSRARFGTPCIRGIRIAVAGILHLLAAGYTVGEMPSQYPGITRHDVVAAIERATRLSEEPTRVLAQR